MGKELSGAITKGRRASISDTGKVRIANDPGHDQLGEFVKDILKDGTPSWVSHPEDYSNWFDEQEKADKERSDASTSQYRIEDQEELTNEDTSLVNFLNVNYFVATLRENGIICKIGQDHPQTCGLYAVRPGYEQLGCQFVTSMQVPIMPEWGLLREEEHGVPNGEAAIGWRQVLAKLIQNKVSTEEKLHRIFGEPAVNARSTRYRRTLQAVRNGRYANDGQY
jgi:hypothetical protein